MKLQLDTDKIYAVALEGSLKMKEISYIHSEAYAAGELKHGTIALISEKRLVVAISCYEAHGRPCGRRASASTQWPAPPSAHSTAR